MKGGEGSEWRLPVRVTCLVMCTMNNLDAYDFTQRFHIFMRYDNPNVLGGAWPEGVALCASRVIVSQRSLLCIIYRWRVATGITFMLFKERCIVIDVYATGSTYFI